MLVAVVSQSTRRTKQFRRLSADAFDNTITTSQRRPSLPSSTPWPIPSPQPTTTTTPQPRIWNRLRTNTADTNGSTASTGEASGSAATGESRFRSRLWNRTFVSDSTKETPEASATTSTPVATGPEATRSRLWNRGGRIPVPVKAQDAAKTASASAWGAPAKLRAWRNRGVAREEGHQTHVTPSIQSVRDPVDPMLSSTANRSHMADVMEILSS